MEKLAACPICSNARHSYVRACLDHTVSRETFTIVSCDSCGFQFTNPRPGKDEIGRYYESEDYISHTGKTTGFIGKAYLLVRKYSLRQKLKLVQTLGPGSGKIRLLDIGCGTGEFLNTCRSGGLDVMGIEPSKQARDSCFKSFGLDVFPEESLAQAPDKSFDVISMWHVLEHVHDLKERVGELARLVKEDGTVLIAVPNRNSKDAEIYGSDWAAYDVPRHLYHFIREDIVRLFSCVNFEVVKTIPMKFDSYYVSMLSSKNSKKGGLISSTWNGAISNLLASTEKGTWSSQIYILKKKRG